LTDGDFTKWRQAMRTHGTQSRSMLCVVRNSCVRDFTPHCRLVQGRYLPDDTVQFVSLTHIVATAELENNNYRMISLTIRTIMLRDSVSAMESHSPVCTITAVSKDLVRRPTRISYDLSLATLSHELGVSFSDSGTIRGKLLDQLRTP